MIHPTVDDTFTVVLAFVVQIEGFSRSVGHRHGGDHQTTART
jgi:hypothetical protein